jgi:hypothetical protein
VLLAIADVERVHVPWAAAAAAAAAAAHKLISLCQMQVVKKNNKRKLGA